MQNEASLDEASLGFGTPVMTDLAVPDLRHPRRSIRLDTILRLRWLAALGQLATIFFVVQSLDFDLPVIPCTAIIALSAVITLALQMALNPMMRLEPRQAAALLGLNIAELAGLLYLTGGLENPFSFLFLGPVLISATGLPTRITIGLGAFAAICATALGFFHLPLPWVRDDSLVLPPVYMAGIWLSILLAIGVTSLYTFQVTEEARKLSDALAATELVLAREQHLTQLDGLAAAAAHELGTPLSTIFLISRELERTTPADSALASDIRTLREQAQRCRDILTKIAQLSSSGAPFDRMPLSTLIEETVAPHRDFGIGIKVRIVEPGMIRTDFGGRSFDFAMDETFTDYAPTAKAMGRLFGKLASDPSAPEVVADVIWQAVNATGDRLRFRAGQDADALIEERKAKDDASFIGRIKEMMGS